MVNLAPAQAAVERLMTDTCRLYRNPGGVEDDTLAPTSEGAILDPGTVEPYYEGKCLFRVSTAAANGVQGSGASIPLEQEPARDDFFEVVASRDPESVGRWFRVADVQGGTFAVSRKLVLAEVAPPW